MELRTKEGSSSASNLSILSTPERDCCFSFSSKELTFSTKWAILNSRWPKTSLFHSFYFAFVWASSLFYSTLQGYQYDVLNIVAAKEACHMTNSTAKKVMVLPNKYMLLWNVCLPFVSCHRNLWQIRHKGDTWHVVTRVGMGAWDGVIQFPCMIHGNGNNLGSGIRNKKSLSPRFYS